jgi:dodecin
MSIAKIIEITADSSKSFDDAVQEGIKRAGESVENIRSAWVKDQEVQLRDGKIQNYRVTLKVTFVVN